MTFWEKQRKDIWEILKPLALMIGIFIILFLWLGWWILPIYLFISFVKKVG